MAAVAKLFLFDLATLPGLVRALAFIAVGVLLLVIGTWYYRQLDRVRRAADLDTWRDEDVGDMAILQGTSRGFFRRGR